MSTILEDKEAIRDLLSDYCICMDNGRFKEMAALFADDGIWQGAVGRHAIEVKVSSVVPAPGEGPGRIHFLSNIKIQVDGNQAIARSNWMVVRSSEQGAMVGAAGTYNDDLIKLDGRWLFRERKINEDIAGDLGLKSQ